MSEPGLSNGVIILAIAIVVGCFAVLWPKIFSPMLFGEPVINTKPIDEGEFSCYKHIQIKSRFKCFFHRSMYSPFSILTILFQAYPTLSVLCLQSALIFCHFFVHRCQRTSLEIFSYFPLLLGHLPFDSQHQGRS